MQVDQQKEAQRGNGMPRTVATGTMFEKIDTLMNGENRDQILEVLVRQDQNAWLIPFLKSPDGSVEITRWERVNPGQGAARNS